MTENKEKVTAQIPSVSADGGQPQSNIIIDSIPKKDDYRYTSKGARSGW